MRKTKWLVILIALAMIWMWGSALASEEEMCVPMGEIELEPLAAEPLRPAVAFPHAVHFGYTCQSCHHTWTGEAPVMGCTTSGCHDLAELPKNEAGQPVQDQSVAIRYYKNAYHDMCIGCHKEIKIKNQNLEASKMPIGEKLVKPGPTGCTECHIPE
jgi:hypothetical protein